MGGFLPPSADLVGKDSGLEALLSLFPVEPMGRQVKTVKNCFKEAETAQSKESKERVYRATRDDYATVVGNLRFPR